MDTEEKFIKKRIEYAGFKIENINDLKLMRTALSPPSPTHTHTCLVAKDSGCTNSRDIGKLGSES